MLAEFGTYVPDDVTIRVHDSNVNMRYLVLPMRPEGNCWSEERFAELGTRDAMIGVTTALRP